MIIIIQEHIMYQIYVNEMVSNLYFSLKMILPANQSLTPSKPTDYQRGNSQFLGLSGIQFVIHEGRSYPV